MFVTGLTYQNLTDREPALADFDTSYATSFTNRIAEAKGVIDNRLRALGYDLDKIGKKTDVWDWDNEGLDGDGTGTYATINKTITGITSGQNLLVFTQLDTTARSIRLLVYGSNNNIIFDHTLTLTSIESYVLSFIDPVSTTFTIRDDGIVPANTFKAYLTDPAIYYIHLYKSLEIIYESMRSNPDDLFERKSLYYGNLYEREFQNLVTFYDSNGDGIASIGEQQSFNRIDLSR